MRERCFRIENGEPVLTPCVDVSPGGPGGLGDALAAATGAVGVKPCGGCKKRQQALNRATPSWARRLLARLWRPYP